MGTERSEDVTLGRREKKGERIWLGRARETVGKEPGDLREDSTVTSSLD